MWHTDPAAARAVATGEAGITIPTTNGSIFLQVDTRDPKGWKAHHNCGGRSGTASEMAFSPGRGFSQGAGKPDKFHSSLICVSCSTKLTFIFHSEMSFTELKKEFGKKRYKVS